jgi:chitin synthase
LAVAKPKESSSFKWRDVQAKNYIVVDGNVLDFSVFFDRPNVPPPVHPLDKAIYEMYYATNIKERDVTRRLLSNAETRDAIQCLTIRFAKANRLEKTSNNCFFSNTLFIGFLIIIMMIVLARFFMALMFSWVIADKLAKDPNKQKCISYPPAPVDLPPRPIPQFPEAARAPEPYIDALPNELYSALLVTCYSEGETSLRDTLDSLAATTYSESRKLLFVIADGIIKGEGNPKTTPDLLIDMIDIDPAWGSDPAPYSYIAIAAGTKQHNMAKVYAGHYEYQGKRVPTILVIKCGTPEERDAAKPGNRGKRDSQIILMGFFSRVLFNERMVPLDFDIFRKIHHLMGVTPDYFETVLMVDADTKVMPDSLTLLNNAVINDENIMGLAGETRITNKRSGFVTGIQVFEYYISHHLGKAFESVFGGVTCLPGCFCMYRLKAPGKRTNEWIPILTKPEVLEEYSQSVVETLHEKNLLLLGEDRFLTTLMLKSFPHRKMMFVPQSVCKTVVPDEFKVLLSQRRRWINSTIHNLLELVLVRNLCGTFCFSMQFVIFMELVGTVSLPVAIVMTYYLIVSLIIQGVNGQLQTFQQFIPLLLLLAVLFLPAILILITTRKVVYVMWMFIYLFGLPIWNFILPVYAYWHFDDFSWGETRKVAGGAKDDHGSGEGTFDQSKVPRKRWEEYERAWRRHISRKKKQQQQHQQLHPQYQQQQYAQQAQAFQSPGHQQYQQQQYQPHQQYNQSSQQEQQYNSPHQPYPPQEY